MSTSRPKIVGPQDAGLIPNCSRIALQILLAYCIIFSSYITGRSQTVRLGNSTSSILNCSLVFLNGQFLASFFSQYIPFSCLPYCTVIYYLSSTLLHITLSALQPYSGIQHLDQCLFTLSLILMVFNKQPLISHSTLRNQTPYFSLLASACTYLSF